MKRGEGPVLPVSIFYRPSEVPMSLPRSFQTFAEFEREIISKERRIGLSLEEMVEDGAFDAETEYSEEDPFAEMADRY